MNTLTEKKIELTAGQILELAYLFECEAASEGKFIINNIVVFETGRIQVTTSQNNKPTIQDISIYD